ncbi:MAG: class I SAM-dependent methyltransferase, partial [Actinomycetia bacterium]|nr:class I SAM-dependent methyltransferase [Actinomycetes bacterium]
MANWSPLSHRPLVPGELRLPWGDETFSSRMLAQHLDEAHDRASRRPAIIDSHIPWLLQQLAVEPTEARILDLGCGPGLYLERLTAGASIGAGVDIAPAAIAWAEQRAGERGLDLSYHLADMLTVDLTGPFDLILDLYGDLSTFDLPSMTLVMERIARWLRPRGRAVIELSTRAGVRQLADLDLPWYPSGPGLFSDTDHLVLREAR